MAVKRMLIGGQLLAVDDQTGELGVKVSGIKFDKDIDIGDAHLLDKSDQKINPATSENIAGITAAMRPVRVAGPTKLTATSVSQTFAQMGLTLNVATVRLRISISSPLRYAWGPVSASSQLLQADIYEETGDQVTGSPADLRTLQFACDVGEVEIWVTEYIS